MTQKEIDWREIYVPEGYTVVTWPDSQELLDEEWMEDFGELIVDEVGLELFGGSAYIVPMFKLQNY